MYFTYILKSLKSGIHYYGSTSNLNERLKVHNRGKVRSTKAHLPWKVHYSEKYKTRSEAFKREQFFKSIKGYNWLRNKGIV